MHFFILLAALACRGDNTAKETDVFDPRDGTVEASDTEDTEDTGTRVDADGDGFPAEADCDDTDPAVNPDADEVCDDIDNDCDGAVDDEDDDVTDLDTFYADEDGDGYGDEAFEACEAPAGTAAVGGDCDDTDPAYNPGADEDDCTDPNDYNCDGSVGYTDDDGDGYAACEECDDSDRAVNPSATELCDDIDNDCNGTVDDDDAVDAATFYGDGDGDGYGDGDVTTTACAAPSGYVADDSDCDDAEATTYPGADETCDDEDDDCDTDIDEDASDASTFYADGDGDGFGTSAYTQTACEQPTGYVSDATDCDDDDATANPDGTEVCGGADEDCDGTTDESGASDAETFYADGDADGFGDADDTASGCEAPTGYVDDATDCDDSDSTIQPDAEEVCDDADNDCDGDVDEDGASDAETFYTDADGDGYGDADSTVVSCEQPTDAVSDATDCDDDDAGVSPAEEEICDAVDNDCDGDADEEGAVDADTWYIDYDDDGYGATAYTSTACEQPSGYVDNALDCDDTEADNSPDGTELCDSEDNDCDGTTDEDGAADAETFYADDDGDGYGDADDTTESCSVPSGYAADDSDCDDDDSAINPAAEEVCDGVDNDCDDEADDGTLGSDATCAAESCLAIVQDGADSGDGEYYLEADGIAFTGYCDMTSDGGGWTLIGSVVNEGTRSWDSISVWEDDTTFGTITDRQSADYKSDAFDVVDGDDFLVHTDEYSFAFYTVLSTQSFSDFIYSEYSSSCATTFVASGADWYDQLTSSQAEVFGLMVAGLDDNASSCFPLYNENTMVSLMWSSCCWVNGLGNTPNGQATWSGYDNSLLQLAYISQGTCTAGSYPCNDNGYYNAGSNAYASTNKVTYGEMYVR